MNAPLVLVVEDDRDVGDALTDLLRELGYGIVWAQDGAEAMRALQAGSRPAAILLDLMMPGMDGYEFRAQQRADPAIADIPVIVLSAVRGAEAAAASLAAVACLGKPTPLDELLAVLSRVAGPAGSVPASLS
jgi:CheY-like chemotaxis protein